MVPMRTLPISIKQYRLIEMFLKKIIKEMIIPFIEIGIALLIVLQVNNNSSKLVTARLT